MRGRSGALCGTGRSHLIVTFNVDHLVTLKNDAEFRQAYADATMRLIDGSPIVAVAKLKRTPVKARVPGSDLMPALCERAARDGLRAFVVGGMPEANQLGVERLRERNPGLVVLRNRDAGCSRKSRCSFGRGAVW